MARMESVLNSSNTTTPFALRIVVCNTVAESQPKRPEQFGLRPKMVFPSLLREDWDEKLTAAGLEHLARQASLRRKRRGWCAPSAEKAHETR